LSISRKHDDVTLKSKNWEIFLATSHWAKEEKARASIGAKKKREKSYWRRNLSLGAPSIPFPLTLLYL